MKLQIIWSGFAEIQLDDIYGYHEMKASSRIADVFDTRQNPAKIIRNIGE